MKILKKLLLLFTSIFTLAILSTVSVFFIEAGPAQKPLLLDLQPFSAISFPSFKSPKISSVSINEDEFLSIEKKLVASYQEASFEFFKVETKYKDIRPINKKRVVEVAPLELAAPPVQASTLLAQYTKVDESQEIAINNNELVKHYGFHEESQVQIVSWAQSYNDLNVLAMINLIDEDHALREDKVELTLASVEKEELKDNWEEEMVFIDYSETQETNLDLKVDTQEQAIASLTDHMDKRQAIPSSVMNVINREMDKRQDVSTKATVDMSSMNFAIDAKAVEAAPKIASSPQADRTKADEYSPRARSTRGRNSVNILSVFEANIDGVNTQKELRNFEFNAEVLSTQRLTDDMNGKIRIEETLNGSKSVARGTVLKHGYMRTKIDLVLEPGQYRINIPLLSQSTLGDFLDKESLVARGGFLMVQMPRDANTIDIDRTYEAKIHLSSKFQVMEYDEDYEYVFFVGVAPGNALLTYTNFRGQRAQKITHIVEDEVLFEGGGFNVQQKLAFSLTQRNMLGTQSAPYNIYPDQINFFNTDIESQQEAVATYSLTTPIKPQGTRNYLEIKSSRYPLFVGLWGDRKLELPSDTFAGYILDSHQLRNLENSCIVQVNLGKAVDEVVLYGETEQGQMGVLKTYLDRDGQFNYEASEMASHIFLVGDAQGVMSLKVKYTDNTVDILQTFCSNNTYLVEQL